VNRSESKKYLKLCNVIEHVFIDGSRYENHMRPCKPGFSFAVFNNLLQLTLHRIKGISTMNLFLEKTTKLTLTQCSDLKKISAWNSTNALDEFVLEDCFALWSLPPFENISVISIGPYDYRCGSFHVRKQKKLYYSGYTLSLETLQIMSTEPSFLNSVEGLILDLTFFPIELSIFPGVTIFRCWNYLVLLLFHYTRHFLQGHQSFMEKSSH
jgi:hypothetical protein